MNNAMSATGQLGTTRYNKTMNNWYGRAYWISDELKPPFEEDQRKARQRLRELTDVAVNKPEKPFFRETFHKGFYKYRPSDFKTVRQIKTEEKPKGTQWTTDNFLREMDKALKL